PRECAAFLWRQRFRQDQVAVERVAQAEPGREPEWQVRVDAAEQAAEAGPDNETEAEARAHQSVGPGALIGWRDIGDIGLCGADAGGSNPGNDTADEQPRQVRSQRHQDVVQPKPEIGYENHAAA